MRFIQPQPRHRAFTLIELLAVIIIIGILMALLIPAVMSARVKAMEARMISEINQLDSAMKEFRTKHAVLPPAWHTDDNGFSTGGGTAEVRVRAFWRRAWPRWNNSFGIPTATTPAPPPGAQVETLSPAEVLVFYLGGVPNTINTGASTKVTGFNLNPLNPTTNAGQRSTPLFQFDQARLMDEDSNGFYEYYPPHKRTPGDGVAPYVYFDSATYGAVTYSHGGATTYGTATPYYDDAVSGKYMNADSFQILSAGLDEHYGAAPPTLPATKSFPSGNNYINEDNDNVSNFSTTRLEDAKP